MISDAQKKATAKYQKKNYDTILIRMRKGKKQIIEKSAIKNNLPLNQYINYCIDKQLIIDGFKPQETETETETGKQDKNP